MNLFLVKAVLKARRQGLVHLVPADEPTRLDCLAEKCAKCCKLLGSPLVTAEEARQINPQSLIRKGNAFFLRAEGTQCCLLREGLCSIYEDRPSGCREYPWYNLGGILYYDTGCPGIKHDRDERPDFNNVRPFERFFPNSPRWIIHWIAWLCKRP
ncbi:MAG: YkgJ family cysteine cluster protein [Sedimentisphaerales bacterium]|nr:YkgJ family cysteine cluster protein [Sedimentisphaerales bacterium]